MSTLSKEFRRQLENTVLKARDEAERGAAAALESYGVADAKLPGHLDEVGKVLRRKLRAHGRQVGDVRRPDDSQEVEHLIHECAYEHWHRMLFARFLAENGFLIEPEKGFDVDFAHCEEEAKRLGIDPWELASRFAQKMLPGIFRPDDPVLQLRLPAESRNRLTALLASLPREVFLADDSLGWVYQFWQAEQKKKINKSEVPIGADELAPVTQLFTEDYMVEFLLHNTLGAWWAGRAADVSSVKFQVSSCPTEEAARKVCALQGMDWKYLRFVQKDGRWTPAAGTFAGWPKSVKELRVLDPSMGSGHFLVLALFILVRMRMEEEGLSAQDACVAVLRDNLFGLELDPRCTQIGAFNLALAAWKMGGHHAELPLNLACSGLGLHAKKEDWLKLADRAAQTNALAADSDLLGAREETLLSQKLKAGMERLYQLFQKAPVLGSLINPRSLGGDLLLAEFHELQPLLAKALLRETGDEAHELALTAQGVAKAAEILAGRFTLVATNVPYLARGGQGEVLSDYCERVHSEAKADLATCFVERSMGFCESFGTVAMVTPQNWLAQDIYENFRQTLLGKHNWKIAAQLGAGAFRGISGEVVKPLLFVCELGSALPRNHFLGIDLTSAEGADAKAAALIDLELSLVEQSSQLKNPKSRISFGAIVTEDRLSKHSFYSNGVQTGDLPRFSVCTWELPSISNGWACKQTTVDETVAYGGMHQALFWQEGEGVLAAFVREKLESENTGAWLRGKDAWGKRGVLVSAMGNLKVSLYLGDLFDDNSVAIIPKKDSLLPAIWALCSDELYHEKVRAIDKALKVRGPLVEVPFTLEHWQKIAAETFPRGLPKPFSSDPTQWLFNGHPKDSDHPLQVAVARLVGYRWPRQTGSSFPDCPALGPDGLEKHADDDGAVCFSQARDEAPAATRLRALLADAYGAEWGHALERKLIADTGSDAKSLEEWLVDDFFAQHCSIFHNRPFVWHIWDGRKDGFNVLLDYHKLAGPDGQGRRTLETLTYAYLGRDWVERRRDAVKQEIAGAEDLLAAAEELKQQLENIITGEPPYDLFIRWKALACQPIEWNPDINDGVRINIRPFMVATLSRGKKSCGLFRENPGNSVKWGKDKGKEPARPKEDFPWFWSWDERTVDFTGNGAFDGNRWNDCHYTTAFKKAARDRKSKK